ncbi:putative BRASSINOSTEROID INSENSITIVE 1-associated receptor kinase 1 precursor [Corchorus olitorius]|uniref:BRASSINOSTEROID INSENSITIVE 1-associated receptor kinase 1 n=1 Tax=Corchorus olitorius TaxID=93759 RepID=A0A1R3H7U7_9ROSI|nr:putative BRASSINOSTEROID INSENSITIVE 1-associated receptor kinase 1 precursor [Corchorus olitorius]
MSEVVVELKECLKKEVARKREGPGTRSSGPRGGISINMDTDPFSTARLAKKEISKKKTTPTFRWNKVI